MSHEKRERENSPREEKENCASGKNGEGQQKMHERKRKKPNVHMLKS